MAVISRRGFVGALASTSTLGIVHLPSWVEANDRYARAGPTRQWVTVLGMPADTPAQRAMQGLSEDVLRRVSAAIGTHRYRTCCHHKLGMRDGGVVLAHQLHTWYRFDATCVADEVPTPFDLEHFQNWTSHWSEGQILQGFVEDVHPPTPLDVRGLRAGRLVGMPYLPDGLYWSAHLIDEPTGLVMRVLAEYDISTDDLLIRWDILYG